MTEQIESSSQAELAKVLTLEQFWARVGRGETVDPTTLVLMPVARLQAVQDELDKLKAAQREKTRTPDIVEMTYVGQYTQSKLVQVKQGKETLSTLLRQRRMMATKLGDLRLSMDETISLLEREHSIQKTVEELNAEIAEYQIAIQNIEREPDAYVLPEIARGWYEQQIARIRKLLQTHPAVSAERQEPHG